MATDIEIGTSHLPGTGVYKYNGVRFTVLGKSKASFKPVPDPAGRMVKWVEHVFEWEGYVTTRDDGKLTTDDLMEDIKQRLSAPQGHLLVYTKGAGNVSVNSPASLDIDPEDIVAGVGLPIHVKDVNFGPWPEVLTWAPVGNDQAALVTFRVKTCIPLCEGSKYQEAPVALTYERTVEIDTDGYATVRFNGTLEIAMTATPDHRLPDSVDAYRHLVRVTLLDGYKREQSYSLDTSKRILTFHITDTQIPVPLLGGASYCELDFTVRSTPQSAFKHWTCTLSGGIRMPAGTPRGAAVAVFFTVAASRLNMATQQLGGGRMVMISEYSATEQVFGKEARFSMSWQLFGSSISEVVNHAGMWRTIEGTTFAKWKRDMDRTAYRQYGNLGLRHRPEDEGVLIDLCTTQTPPQIRQTQQPPPVSGDRVGGGLGISIAGARPPAANPPGGQGRPGIPLQFGVVNNDAVQANRERDFDPRLPPQNTWVEWTCAVSYDQEDFVCVHTPIGIEPQRVNVQYPVTGQASAAAATVAPAATPERVPESQGNVVQQIAGSTQMLWLKGFATRGNFEIAPPRLISAGGIPGVQKHYHFQQTVVARSGVRIFQAEWAIGYVLSRPPATLPLPSNPLLGTNGHQ